MEKKKEKRKKKRKRKKGYINSYKQACVGVA